MVAAIAIPLLLFTILFLIGAIGGGGHAWLRVGGQRIEIPVAIARIVLVPLGIGMLGFVLLVVRAGIRDAWRVRARDSRALEMLEAGERPLWQARPGLRTLSWPRAVALAVAVTTPILCARWAWWSFFDSATLGMGLFWLGFPVFAFCFWILPALVSGSGTMLDWVRDIFGSVVVTDRRIVWLSPNAGAIYRQIDGADLIEAMLVDAGKGWVAVTSQRGRRVREIDLWGLPQPEAALRAIETMMAEISTRAGDPPPR